MPNRVPPQAPDVERSVLGSIMIDANALNDAMEFLDDDVFYVEAHRLIFSCMRDMYAAGTPVDIVTMAEGLRRRGHLQAAGEETYLSELASSVATSANIRHYADILIDRASRRNLIAASAQIADGENNMGEPQCSPIILG